MHAGWRNQSSGEVSRPGRRKAMCMSSPPAPCTFTRAWTGAAPLAPRSQRKQGFTGDELSRKIKMSFPLDFELKNIIFGPTFRLARRTESWNRGSAPTSPHFANKR